MKSVCINFQKSGTTGNIKTVELKEEVQIFQLKVDIIWWDTALTLMPAFTESCYIRTLYFRFL